jgi:hypothetical protein
MSLVVKKHVPSIQFRSRKLNQTTPSQIAKTSSAFVDKSAVKTNNSGIRSGSAFSDSNLKVAVIPRTPLSQAEINSISVCIAL